MIQNKNNTPPQKKTPPQQPNSEITKIFNYYRPGTHPRQKKPFLCFIHVLSDRNTELEIIWNL